MLFALVSSISINYKNFLRDRLNKVLLVFLLLLILSNLNFYFNNNSLISINKAQGLIDLFNWIPQILCFWFFQEYLSSSRERILFAKYLLIGSIPVILSFVSQIWFGMNGPYRLFFNLIIWYQREYSSGRFAGLFSNANYAAFWLSLILPISLAFFLNKKKNFFLTIYIFFIVYCGLLTGSRNFILSSLLSVCILAGIKIFFIIILILLSLYLLTVNNLFEFEISNQFFKQLTPGRIFSPIYGEELNTIKRIDIYQTALGFIRLRPLWGWGAGSFPILYELYEAEKGKIIQHSHNFLLEITFNYGIFVTIILLFFLLIIFYKACKLVLFDMRFNTNLNKAFLASSFSIFVFQITDFTYYEGKISLLTWIMFSTLNSIIIESKKIKV